MKRRNRNNKSRNGGLTPEQFVVEWQKATSLRALAKLCGVTKVSAAVRACRYRKAGVPLKRMPPDQTRTCIKLNVVALADLCRRTPQA